MTPPKGPAAPVVKQERASPSRFKAEVRKAIRRNAHEQEVNFLNIVALLDCMTIILVFLLKTLGESTATIPQSDDLKIPTSFVMSQPSQEGVVVTVSKSQVLVGDERILALPSRQAMAQGGVGAQHKRSGANDLYIVPLGNALKAARTTDKLVRQAKGLDASMSEAIIIADQTTPYRLFIEVLYTLGQSEFGKYHLMVMQKKSTRG